MTVALRDRLAARLAAGGADAIIARGDPGAADPVEKFLSGTARLSPFLGRMITKEPERLSRVMAASPDDLFADLLAPLRAGADDVETTKKQLRDVRNDVALAVALADLGDVFDLNQVTETLTRLADGAVAEALRVAALAARELRGVVFDGEPLPDHGILIVAMGKLGARELNYSSDIDLIAIYDPGKSRLSTDSRLDARGLAVKTVQLMVEILNQPTVDGFVFRTDLRLRPNPSATSLAVSFPAAERYYEEYGQNWERAAYIKGRNCAGDAELGETFRQMIVPFIWRRTLDFGAVADIRAVKEQIHAEKGRPDISVAGANIKLGLGGIREIEFFVQMQQLLQGGRDRSLRLTRTEDAMLALSAAGHFDRTTADRMNEAYRFLRDLEHRLQMREDCQTQELPETHEELTDMAALMNLADADEFIRETERRMRYVHDTYADLFAAPSPKTPVPGSLVFTGVEDDPRTLDTLREIGFEKPELVTARIRRWYQGGLRATRSPRARELLTALVPRMLMGLGDLKSPDAGFSGLDNFLSRLPSGIQMFSLFTAHPEVLDDILILCQSSPELMRKFGDRPALMEGLVEGVDISPPEEPMADEGAELELHLDLVRREVNEHRIRAAAALVLGQRPPAEISRALSRTADVAITDLMAAVRREEAARGKNPAGPLAAVGFGRLGIESLTILSDLDLVFVFETEDDRVESEQLFTRLVRRIVTALSVQTAEGGLFTIDMQLRPSGRAGPTAVSFRAFDQYYAETAWTWEMMALTKARVVSGEPGFASRLDSILTESLRRPQEPEKLKADIADMRRRLLAEKPPRTSFDVKRLKGGLTDIEFIAAFLTLSHPMTEGRLPRHPRAAIVAHAERGVIAENEARVLLDAYDAVESVIQFLRATEGNVAPEILLNEAAARLRQIEPNWSDDPIERQLTAHREKVGNIFERMIGPYSA